MAQLTERLLPTPKDPGSNPFIEHLFTNDCLEMTKTKEKDARNGPLKNTHSIYV